MIQTDIFVIEYKLHGQQKSFVIRAKQMRNIDAWQWARLSPAADGLADRLHRCCLTRVCLKTQVPPSKFWRQCSRFEAKAKAAA